MKRGLIAFVRWYQRDISPLFPRRCKYHPTCSEYAVESIEMFGVSRGIVLAVWRLLRCNPWSSGGVDYPADQHLFGAR
ncbi:MAG: membrane protein insertion efficiency factor YidD [Actinobacteria bacterium]|nr:membrane protein insertion efficiency factor YidD [Actinomycetota bacterium]